MSAMALVFLPKALLPEIDALHGLCEAPTFERGLAPHSGQKRSTGPFLGGLSPSILLPSQQ